MLGKILVMLAEMMEHDCLKFLAVLWGLMGLKSIDITPDHHDGEIGQLLRDSSIDDRLLE